MRPSPARASTVRARALPARLALLPLVLALGACGDDDSDYDFEGSRTELETQAAAAAAPQAAFDPGAGVLPFPNDLLFLGSEDGTLNAPVDDPADVSDPAVALNQVDGFSTVAPISIGTSGSVDQGSLTGGPDGSVRVFQVESDPATTAVTGLVRELDAAEFVIAATDSGIALLPTAPLAPRTAHLVIVTTAVAGANGEPLAPTLQYGLAAGTTELTGPAAALEPVRGLTQAQLAVAESQGIARDDVALSFTFRTQSIREPLQAAEDQVTPRPLVLAPTGLNTSQANAALPGTADIWVGSLQLPYYLTAADPNDPSTFQAAIGSTWNNAAGGPVNPTDFAPVATSDVTVPVLMTVPNAASPGGGTPPAGGWPVTIFQHGITRNRTDVLALADAMAAAGRVVIAIDQPVHGVVLDPERDEEADGPDPFAQLLAANAQFGATERHFGIDLQDNATGAPGPDGLVDPSGTYFINLANLGNTRDNLREAAADLLTLSASVAGAVVPTPDGGAVPAAEAGLPLNAADKSFVGHSLGGIVGTTMLSYDGSFTAGSLVFPGGGIAQLVANSDELGPRIIDGLAAAAGVDTDDDAALAEFAAGGLQDFLVAAQTVIDSGDPINHAPFLGADETTAVHLVEVIDDAVIPNFVPTAPLSGTRPLARVLGLPRVATDASGDAWVRLSEGDHGSILSPEASAAATAEIQRQVAAYAASAGTQLPITDGSVIAPLDAEDGR